MIRLEARFRKRIIIMLFAIFTALILFSVFVSKEKVDAQIIGFGVSCTTNFPDCDPGSGQRNLKLAIDSGDITLNGFTEAMLNENSLRQTYVVEANRICIDDTIDDITAIAYAVGEDFAGRDNLDAVYYENGLLGPGYAASPRTCGDGLIPAQIEGRRNRDIWACCPENYAFVNRAPLNAFNFVPNSELNTQRDGACCLKPTPGSSVGSPNYPVAVSVTGRCTAGTVGAGGTLIMTTPIDYNTVSYRVQDPGGSDYPEMMNFFTNPDVLGSSLLPTTSAVLSVPDRVCPGSIGSDGCALDNNAGTTNIYYQSADREITTPALMATTVASRCLRCFADAEPITVVGNQLITCNNGATASTALINNSVGDTLAVLNASGEENRDFIESCRAKGGVPSAIGCVDSTPLGVITGLIRIALGTVGGIALVRFFIIGASLMRGDDSKIKEHREKLLATLTGVAVLVFSVLILRILGINILDVIPTGTI